MVFFDFLDPGGRSRHVVELEHPGVEDFVQVKFAVVTFDNLRLGLQGADNGLDAAQFLGCHFGYLVEHDDVAEFDLLDDQAFDVFLVQMRFLQVLATGELALHPHRIDHRRHTVEHRDAILHIFESEGRNRADGLGDGFRFANAAGLDDDVVEFLACGDFHQLLDQVVFQRTADAAVLQGDQALVLLAHDAALLDQVRIDVHFADIIHDHREADALAVVQDSIDQGGFSAAEITGQQQDRNFLQIFHDIVSFCYCFFSKCW